GVAEVKVVGMKEAPFAVRLDRDAERVPHGVPDVGRPETATCADLDGELDGNVPSKGNAELAARQPPCLDVRREPGGEPLTGRRVPARIDRQDGGQPTPGPTGVGTRSNDRWALTRIAEILGRGLVIAWGDGNEGSLDGFGSVAARLIARFAVAPT